MEALLHSYDSLSASVHAGAKDTSLLLAFQTRLFSLHTTNIDTRNYARLMISLYDLSNSHKLMDPKNPSTLHPFAIKLKLMSMKMIMILLQFISGNMAHRLDREVEGQALEIMILSCRLCLDSSLDCTSDLVECQRCCDQLFQISRDALQDKDLETIYIINKLDMLRLTVDSQKFRLADLIKYVKRWDRIGASEHFKEYFSYLITEIVLKLLRKGFPLEQCLPELQRYLSPKYQSTLAALVNNHERMPQPGEFELGSIYELYWQIKANGIQSISEECLEQFISDESVLGGKEIFQAALLTNEPLLLKMWFVQCNRKNLRPQNVALAYECFLSLLTLFHRQQHDGLSKGEGLTADSLIHLSRQVLLNLMGENPRQTILPVDKVCSSLGKFIVSLVARLIPTRSLSQLFTNLHLVCTKYSLNETAKVMSALQLYAQLLEHSASEQTYRRFLKYNGSDKTSLLVKSLNSAYHLQKSKGGGPEYSEALASFKGKPQLLILFCDDSMRSLLILDIECSNFAAMPRVLGVYEALLQEHVWNDENCLKIANHLSSFLLSCDFARANINSKDARLLKEVLNKKLKNENRIFCLLWIYCYCLERGIESIRKEQFGVAFNKFSKILKMLGLVQETEELISVLQMLICKSCQAYKQAWIKNSKEVSQEAGEVMFLNLIFEKVEVWAKSNPSSERAFQYTQFSLFQIYCVTGRNEEAEDLILANTGTQLEQLCLNSDVIPKNHKLRILRSLFKQSLGKSHPVITIKQLEELILLGDSDEECLIYIDYMVQTFGEKAKKLLILLASENQKLADLLVKTQDED